ncbi:unnamed protein product [Cochlearia groenlandica]
MGSDQINELPDSLLTQILSYLPTKDSVKTSVLSKRWKCLWLSVPVLDLNVSDLPGEVFPSFINRFLESNHRSKMLKFKITYVDPNIDCDRLVELIATVVDIGVRHLDVETNLAPRVLDFMPQNIYKSNTLVSLKLKNVDLEDPVGSVVSLPCLKILHLEDICFYGDTLFMEKLLSGCPVLEDLTLIRPFDFYFRDVLMFLRVRSQTLKRFCFTFAYRVVDKTHVVEIDAPRLEYLSFKDKQSDMIVVKNLSSLFIVDIDTTFNVEYHNSPLDLRKISAIHEFLTGIFSVKHMIISLLTLKVLYRYSNSGKVPKFGNLYRLEARFSSFILPFLPVFLESCPNLKHLILDFGAWMEPEQAKLTYVPQCLSMNLECVEIKELTVEDETWKKLAMYFIENSAVLKKLVLRFKEGSSVISNQDSDISKELLTYTKISHKCQIIIH